MNRTVTISTVDYGEVTIPEPPWCAGEHPSGGYRIDISHYGPDVPLPVETSRGRVTAMTTALEQRPFTERHPGRGVFINVEIDGDHYPHDPDELHRLAAALDHHAQRLRVLGDELATLVQEHQQ